VGSVLLLTVDRDPGRVYIHHYPLRRIDGFDFTDEFAVDAGQIAEVLLFGQHLGLKGCKREVSAAPRSQIFSELIGRNVGSCESRSASLTSSYPAMRL
jgi:hypothetical protein